MEHFKMSGYRIPARAVGYVDLILVLLTLFGLFATILISTLLPEVHSNVVGSIEIETVYEHEENANGDKVNYVILIIWVLIGITAVVALIQLFAAVNLIKSTAKHRTLSESTSLAKFWLVITVIFFLITSAGYVAEGNWIFLAVSVVLRVTFIVIVCKFIEELEQLQQESMSTTS